MTRTRAALLSLGASIGWIALLELGALRRVGAVFAAHQIPSSELDAIRALVWLVAGLGAVGLYLALSPRGAPDLRGVLADRDWLLGLLDGMSEGVIAFDPNGRVVFANPAALELLGRRGLPDGTPMIAFADIPRLRSTVVAALRGGTPVTREIEVPGPPARTAILRATPTRQGAVAVLLDVSDQRRLERTWRDFAGNASHELRTPVAALLANLEVLSGLDPESDPAPFLEAGLRQARRLASLVGDLLDLVRLESGRAPLRAEPVGVADAARRVIEEAVAPVTLVPTGDTARGDPTAIHQVLANYVSNALRYAPGPVEIRSTTREQVVRIEVCDRGPGVPPEHVAHLFERFYRVDTGRSRDAGGTGLGLAIVRELADAMGGRAGVSGREGGGSVFWVELPTLDAPPLARTPAPALSRHR